MSRVKESHAMKVEYVSFNSRPARTEYLSKRFNQYLTGQVLDVGCDRAILRDLMPELDYTGVDVGGNPDIPLDLEAVDVLPFSDNAFECVLCIEVLEHLNNLHTMFDELIRVSKRYVIVSLPNCWAGARKPLGIGKGSFAHYGLPDEPPLDRHKWFFSLSDGRRFFEQQALRKTVRILELHATEKPRPLLVRTARKIRYPRQENYLNRYAHTLWVVLSKR